MNRVHGATFHMHASPHPGSGPWGSRVHAEGGTGIAAPRRDRRAVEQAELAEDLRRVVMAMLLGVINVATIQRLKAMGFGALVEQVIRAEVAGGRLVTSGMQADLQSVGINVPVSLSEEVTPGANAPTSQRTRACEREASNKLDLFQLPH